MSGNNSRDNSPNRKMSQHEFQTHLRDTLNASNNVQYVNSNQQLSYGAPVSTIKYSPNKVTGQNVQYVSSAAPTQIVHQQVAQQPQYVSSTQQVVGQQQLIVGQAQLSGEIHQANIQVPVKEIQVPIEVEKRVEYVKEVPKEIIKYVEREYEVERIVEKIVEVPYEKIVYVDVPVEKIIERIVEIPVEHHKEGHNEKLIHHPHETIRVVTIVEEVEKEIIKEVIHEVPEPVERIVYKEMPVTQEKCFVQDIEIVEENHTQQRHHPMEHKDTFKQSYKDTGSFRGNAYTKNIAHVNKHDVQYPPHVLASRAYQFLLNNMSGQSVDALIEGFNRADINHDGKVTKEELFQAYPQARQENLNAFFEYVDTNHDGFLSKQEWSAALNTLQCQQKLGVVPNTPQVQPAQSAPRSRAMSADRLSAGQQDDN